MDRSRRVYHKESCVKLRYVYIMECLSQGKLFKVAVCIYHQVFISRKVVLKLQYGYIMIKCSSQGKLFKFAVCIYQQLFIHGKLFQVAV